MAVEAAWPKQLWHPIRDRGEPRLLFISRPDAATASSIDAMIVEHRLHERFGSQAFVSENWHQSVSDRYLDTPSIREALLHAGASLQAPAFTLLLDRLHASKNLRDSHNWDIRCRQESQELVTLVEVLNAAIAAQGLPRGGGHSPHVTLCYSALASLLRDEPIRPIEWTIDSIELVLGSGHPYGYTTLGRWSLGPEAPRVFQASMF